MPPQTMLGWHWLAVDRRLQHGARQVVEVGRTYTATGPPGMCRNGMHASRRALDALEYAPGPIICRVRLGGPILHDDDKSVAATRIVLWMADATIRLHEFALVCAQGALGSRAATGAEVDARSWAVLEIKRRWLKGKATDQELSAARSAAESAARSAARSAAQSAAWSAAWSAENMILESMLEGLR
ncbi:MAG: hypothetical protein HW395_37 [candidate division NC10 bacterium]|nr:hypothetical protein [candidate division NC10 bacterium]